MVLSNITITTTSTSILNIIQSNMFDLFFTILVITFYPKGAGCLSIDPQQIYMYTVFCIHIHTQISITPFYLQQTEATKSFSLFKKKLIQRTLHLYLQYDHICRCRNIILFQRFAMLISFFYIRMLQKKAKTHLDLKKYQIFHRKPAA